MSSTTLKILRERRGEQLQSYKFVKDSQISNNIVAKNYERLLRNYPKFNIIDDDSDIDIPISDLIIDGNKPTTQQSKQAISNSGILNQSKNSSDIDIPIGGKSSEQKFRILSNRQSLQSKKGVYSSSLFFNNSKELQNSQIFDDQSWSKIQQILEKQNLFNLAQYKTFVKQQLLRQGKYKTNQPFKSILFFGLDQVLKNDKKGKQIIEFMINNNIKVFLNENIQKILQEHASICFDEQKQITEEQQLQIKKLFLEFYVENIDNNKPCLSYVQQYTILDAIIEIIVLNFINKKLGETDKKQMFSQQYSHSDEGDPQTILQTFCSVFELKLSKNKEQQPIIYTITSEHGKFNIEIEQNNYTTYISNG